jgi:hypothetical protein
VRDRAIVVGCDAYRNVTGGELRGAVRDAIEFTDWLLAPDGGGLSRSDVTLMLSSTVRSARPGRTASGKADSKAEVAAFTEAMTMQWNSPAGRRLYVYFAGHGCRTDPVNPPLSQDVIAFADFSPVAPSAGCIAIPALLTRLEVAAPYDEVVVIVDACRDLPFDRPFSAGWPGLDVGPRSGGQGGAAQVYLLQSVSPEEQARETSDRTPARGVFSRALTRALRGDGIAKEHHPDDDTGRPYRVTWASLLRYLTAAMPDRTPRDRGPHEGLVLATFPAGQFPDVALTVDVLPGSASAGDLAALQVSASWFDAGRVRDPSLEQPGPAPVTFTLRPVRHTLTAVAGRHLAKEPVQLYEDCTVSLTLAPSTVEAEPASADGRSPRHEAHLTRTPTVITHGYCTGPTRLDGSDLTYMPGKGLGATSRPAGDVIVASRDPAAVVRLRDGSGTIVASAIGRLVVGRPAPGSYTAAALDFLGHETCRPVEVRAGDREQSVTMPGREHAAWPERQHRLRFSCPASWVMGTGWRPPAPSGPGILDGLAPPGQGVIVLVRRDRQTPAADLVAVPVTPGGDTQLFAWSQHHDGPETVVAMGCLEMTLPVIPDAVTSVVIDTDQWWVRVYDRALSENPLALMRLDRAQDLLAAGRETAAGILLQDLELASPVARHLLAMGRRGDSDLLPGGLPWRVTGRTVERR